MGLLERFQVPQRLAKGHAEALAGEPADSLQGAMRQGAATEACDRLRRCCEPGLDLALQLPHGFERMTGTQEPRRSDTRVVGVPGQQFVRALAVQEDLEVFAAGGLHDGVLGMDGRAPVRLALRPQHRHQHRQDRRPRRGAVHEPHPGTFRGDLREARLIDPLGREPGMEREPRQLLMRAHVSRREQVRDGDHDRGRVQPAGQACPDRDVGPETETDGCLESLPELVDKVLVAPPCRL